MATKKKRDWLKTIGLVTAGAIAEIAVESVADLYAPQYVIMPGTTPINTGDVVGAAEGAVVTFIGASMKKEWIAYLGVGGLASAIPNLLRKAVTNAGVNIPVPIILPVPLTNQGRYGRNVAYSPMMATSTRYNRYHRR